MVDRHLFCINGSLGKFVSASELVIGNGTESVRNVVKFWKNSIKFLSYMS